MLVRILGVDLPGTSCGPSPERPAGHHGIHVAVQGRKGPDDLHGMVPADAATATWELPCTVVSPPPEVDLRGPQIHGSPRRRFIYLSWGTVGEGGDFQMFRRAKLLLDRVPADVMAAAVESGVLVGRLGLTDAKGNPRCAGVGPEDMEWSAVVDGERSR